eukprot:4395315-Amphidinium_carterae.1
MTTAEMPLERIVNQVATIAQTVADVRSWLKASPDVPLRPLQVWGTLWTVRELQEQEPPAE